MGPVVFEFGEKLQAPKDYMSFLTHFFTVSLASLVESWVLREMDETPEKMIEMIDLFIQDQLRGAKLRIKKG
ncbi:TetR-like C-terminal domain-containing protein [Ureibacillus acetophenoni]|nr:TetR-like C-terminal domain-containing protein [Ureibacillus acetophenoni]